MYFVLFYAFIYVLMCEIVVFMWNRLDQDFLKEEIMYLSGILLVK